MNTFYGVWSPALGVLPSVTDLDFAAYYITESGALNGTTYTKDHWLVYICESRGTLSERSYWRITDGIVCFNPDKHTNVPDAGWYTKVRLDNAGNIVAGGDIEYDDLPQEVYKKLEAITDDNLNKLIAKQLSTIFTNNTLNPIQFKFDPATGKISANLKLDEETISINEFGQLCAVGLPEGEASESGSGSGTINVDLSAITSEITQLKNRLNTVEESIIKIKPLPGDGIKVEVTKGGSVISVDIDENSLGFDREGRLCVNPDILSDYLNGEGGDCANHQHTASQIKDLEEFVKNIINNVSLYQTLVQNLSNLIDEETIIINKNGQLEAIATNVQKHQHKMADITDLNPEIADVWATNQRLHKSNDNQDFNSGAVMMSSLTVGEVLIAFNQLLKDYKDAIDNIDDRVGTIEPTEPECLDLIDIKNKAEEIEVLDVTSLKKTYASNKILVGTDGIVFYNGCRVEAYIDDSLVETLNCYDDGDTTFGEGKRGNFNITYFGEAYPKFKSFHGYYKGFSFDYEADAAEGTHKIYFIQRDANNPDIFWKSNTVYVNVYNDFEPSGRIDIVKQPTYNNYVSGVKASKGDIDIAFRLIVKNFKSQYAPIDPIVVDAGYNIPCEAYELSNGQLIYETKEISMDDFFGKIKLIAEVKSLTKSTTIEQETDFINIDYSDEEEYRYVGLSPYAPEDGVIEAVQKYVPTDKLPIDEAQVKDHNAIIGKTDYTQFGIGPDYSDKPATQTITLRFPCPRMNNFFMDIVDDEEKPYPVNKNGTLKGIEIYASVAPSNVLTRWVNCNVPYAGFGHWSNRETFNGLDLFRSTQERRWVTFGKDPIVDEGYLYIKLLISKPVNLRALIKSIEESINERR